MGDLIKHIENKDAINIKKDVTSTLYKKIGENIQEIREKVAKGIR